jgi:hypothetical protein
MFQISKAFQDMYGYPELTQELKAKIFGLNAAKIYKINPIIFDLTVRIWALRVDAPRYPFEEVTAVRPSYTTGNLIL